MHNIYFKYNGRQYSGYIVSSTDEQPHFHWFYFNDRELEDLVGSDCISFTTRNEELVLSERYPESLEQLTDMIKSLLIEKFSKREP